MLNSCVFWSVFAAMEDLRTLEERKRKQIKREADLARETKPSPFATLYFAGYNLFRPKEGKYRLLSS